MAPLISSEFFSAAKVDRTDFQGALAAVHRRLKQFASDPDSTIAPALVQFVPKPVLNRVTAAMGVLGDRLN